MSRPLDPVVPAPSRAVAWMIQPAPPNLPGTQRAAISTCGFTPHRSRSSGVSGAGKTPSERTHFSECHGSIAAYGVFAHRHAAEIEQEIGASVTFVPHLVPLDRGILETIYARLRPGVDAEDIGRVLTSAYEASPFVRLTGAELPEIKHVAHTNFCDIGWRVSGRQLVMVAVIDNLVKGAAGQAIQNFNVAFGFEETLGLS